MATAQIRYQIASNGFSGQTATGFEQEMDLASLVNSFGASVSLADLANILILEAKESGNVALLAEIARSAAGAIPEAIAAGKV